MFNICFIWGFDCNFTNYMSKGTPRLFKQYLARGVKFNVFCWTSIVFWNHSLWNCGRIPIYMLRIHDTPKSCLETMTCWRPEVLGPKVLSRSFRIFAHLGSASPSSKATASRWTCHHLVNGQRRHCLCFCLFVCLCMRCLFLSVCLQHRHCLRLVPMPLALDRYPFYVAASCCLALCASTCMHDGERVVKARVQIHANVSLSHNGTDKH